MSSPILQPVVALVLWSLVMWAWLYATRIPALRKAGFELRPDRSKEEMNAALPPQVRWKTDNYNHLMEQPTIFYATALALAVLGQGRRPERRPRLGLRLPPGGPQPHPGHRQHYHAPLGRLHDGLGDPAGPRRPGGDGGALSSFTAP
jgi:hypothetical protein